MGNEYKDKVGGPELGVPQTTASGYYSSEDQMTRSYHSSQDGVPIQEPEGNPRQIIRLMEKVVPPNGISSWIDNF